MSVRRNIPFSRKVALAVVAAATCLVASARAEPSAPQVSPAAAPAGVPVTSPPEKVLPPGTAWGGWYLGGHVGYAHGMANTTLCDSAPPTATSSFASLYGGALVGYAVELPARLLLGLEADVSFPNFFDEDDLISSRNASGGRVAERLDLLSRARGSKGRASRQPCRRRHCATRSGHPRRRNSEMRHRPPARAEAWQAARPRSRPGLRRRGWQTNWLRLAALSRKGLCSPSRGRSRRDHRGTIRPKRCQGAGPFRAAT